MSATITLSSSERDMERHELRVGKLEAQTIMQGGEPYIRFIAEPGESSDACVRRHWHDPDAPGAHYVVRYFIEPEPRTTQRCGGDHA